MQVGVFLSCFQSNEKCYCIVRHLEPLMVGTTPQLNQFDCPLLTLTNILRVLPSVNNFCSVSVVHQCSTTCILKEKAVDTRLERHRVTQNTFFLLHDWSNTVYCYNLFCISNNIDNGLWISDYGYTASLNNNTADESCLLRFRFSCDV